jgi:hypothetical protein
MPIRIRNTVINFAVQRRRQLSGTAAAAAAGGSANPAAKQRRGRQPGAGPQRQRQEKMLTLQGGAR